MSRKYKFKTICVIQHKTHFYVSFDAYLERLNNAQ
jgi:hypothetical protein